MSKDGEIFIQSDILKLFESMTNTIEQSRYFFANSIRNSPLADPISKWIG